MHITNNIQARYIVLLKKSTSYFPSRFISAAKNDTRRIDHKLITSGHNNRCKK